MKNKGFAILIFIVLVGGFFYFRYQAHNSRGKFTGGKIFEIKKGEGGYQIASNLEKEGLVSSRFYVYYYLRKNGLTDNILPGKYELNGNMTAPEIALTVTNEEMILPGYASITFPEGWDSKKMAERLVANGLPGEEFLRIVNNPGDLTEKFDFLKGSKTLEGFLFPDTYFFSNEISADLIIGKMLENFEKKLSPEIKETIEKRGESIQSVLIMASIVEMEVKTQEDREIVSGIYWNRLKIGQPLQSDITLTYILGVNKKQYSYEDTRTPSPYNTYLNKGLPPGPIGNPGISAIKAAVFPKDTNYNYYLSDPETGKTVYASSFEEHKRNKEKYGF